MKRTSLKFVHLADLHLDRSLFGGKMRLPYEKAELRRRELREALIDCVSLAREEAAELIIIAGDLWEEDKLSPDTLPFVMDTLGAAGVPVVIAPGNHDYFSPTSHYSDDIAQARTGKKWPKNVHVFREYEFQHKELPDLDGVAVTGLAYRSNKSVQLRRFGGKIKPPKADINICIAHGSRENHLPPGKMRTLPFKDEELLKQPFDYVALGHYHSRGFIEDDKGKVRAAYPGSTCGLIFDEVGQHGCLVGNVKSGGIAQNDIKFVEIDKRRLHNLQIDISGLQHVQAVEAKIHDALENENVRKQDILSVKLTGTYPQGSRVKVGDEFSDGKYFHFTLDVSGIRPEWDIEEDSTDTPKTTEGMFRNRMREMIEEAFERGDEHEASRFQNALYYGLDALHSEKITPRQSS